tara:strand:- start:8075 stop:8392 length:318 start_codon:yes stop_codon:yes gene_type:complete
MEFEPKYIEDKEIKCRFDDYFIDELITLPYNAAIGIMDAVKINSSLLPEKDNWSQIVAGVIKGRDPFFFELEYIKEKGEDPLYLDILEINCDEYLDYINLNQFLK